MQMGKKVLSTSSPTWIKAGGKAMAGKQHAGTQSPGTTATHTTSGGSGKFAVGGKAGQMAGPQSVKPAKPL